MELEKKDKILLVIFIILFIISFIFIFVLILCIKEENYEWNMKELSVVQSKIKDSKKYNIFNDFNYIHNYPVYYINLKKSKDRDELMKTQFELFGINNKRIEAFDGNSIIDKSKGIINNEKYYNEYTELKNNEIACTLSHVKAIREAYKYNNDYAFIMEDDCLLYLMPFWGFDINYIISKAPKDWGILQLHIFSNKCKDNAKESIKEGIMFSDIDNKIHCYSTAVYLINKKGMRDILNKCGYYDDYIIKKNNYNGVADVYIYSLTKTYYINIPLFLTADENFESTIQDPSHRISHMNTSNQIINMYKNMNGKKIDNFLNYQFDMIDVLNLFDNFMKENKVKYILMKDTLLDIFKFGKFDNKKNIIHVGINIKNINNKLIESMNSIIKIDKIIKNKENIINIELINDNKIVIKIYIIFNDYYIDEFSNIKKLNNFAIESINFSGNNYDIFSPPMKYLEYEFGLDWFIPSGMKINNRINVIYPRLLKESKKPLLWIYYDDKYHNREYYKKSIELIKSRCKSTFNIVIIDDEIYKIIVSDNNISNINPIDIRIEYIKFNIINEYGGIFVDVNNIIFKKIDFLQYKLRTFYYVTYGNEDKVLCNRIIGGRKYNRISNKILEIFDNKFNWKNNNINIDRNEYNKIFTIDIPKFIEEIKYIYPFEIEILDEKNIYPISMEMSDIFFNKEGEVNFNKFKKYNMISLDYEYNMKNKEDDKNTRVYKIYDYYLS